MPSHTQTGYGAHLAGMVGAILVTVAIALLMIRGMPSMPESTDAAPSNETNASASGVKSMVRGVELQLVADDSTVSRTLRPSAAGTAAVSAVPSSRAGVAGGLSFMFHLCFGALGVAGATAIMNAQTAGADPATLTKAFAAGMSHAYWLAVALALLGIVVAAAIDEKKLQAAHD